MAPTDFGSVFAGRFSLGSAYRWLWGPWDRIHPSSADNQPPLKKHRQAVCFIQPAGVSSCRFGFPRSFGVVTTAETLVSLSDCCGPPRFQLRPSAFSSESSKEAGLEDATWGWGSLSYFSRMQAQIFAERVWLWLVFVVVALVSLFFCCCFFFNLKLQVYTWEMHSLFNAY